MLQRAVADPVNDSIPLLGPPRTTPPVASHSGPKSFEWPSLTPPSESRSSTPIPAFVSPRPSETLSDTFPAITSSSPSLDSSTSSPALTQDSSSLAQSGSSLPPLIVFTSFASLNDSVDASSSSFVPSSSPSAVSTASGTVTGFLISPTSNLRVRRIAGGAAGAGAFLLVVVLALFLSKWRRRVVNKRDLHNSAPRGDVRPTLRYAQNSVDRPLSIYDVEKGKSQRRSVRDDSTVVDYPLEPLSASSSNQTTPASDRPFLRGTNMASTTSLVDYLPSVPPTPRLPLTPPPPPPPLPSPPPSAFWTRRRRATDGGVRLAGGSLPLHRVETTGSFDAASVDSFSTLPPPYQRYR